MALIYPYSLHPSPEVRLFRAIASAIFMVAILAGLGYAVSKITITMVLWCLGITFLLGSPILFLAIKSRFSTPPKE